MPRATARAEAARRLGKEPGRRARSSSSPPPPAPWDRGPRREADRRQMAHAGEAIGRGSEGAPAAGCCLSLGGGGEQPPKARHSGSLGGWRLRIVPSREPGRGGRGGQKERAVREGLLEGKEGSPGRKHWLETRGAALFPTWGTAEGPGGRGSGNRMGGGGRR